METRKQGDTDEGGEMNDIDCPYCGKGQDINHDDGYGYEEDEVFEQECCFCDKVFVFTTAISFYYEAEKAPCKNGEGEHEWRDKIGSPRAAFMGKQFCSVCDEQRDTMAPEDRNAAMEKYFTELRGE